VNLWYHVGSKNERPGRTGFAHLFEHMLFQGSENVGTNDHFRYLQQVGGVANGSTWYDRTNYFETLPAHHLDLGLWLESDRMGFLLPALTAEKLETQRDVVMNERRQRVDNQPYARPYERLFQLLFPPEHPYHWPVIGWMEDIAAATLEDVRAFFSTWYTPNNAVLSLAGDFEPQTALDRVRRFFADLPAGPAAPVPRPVLPPLATRVEEVIPDRVQLPRLYLALRTPPYGSREWYAAALLASVLADGKSSPLYRDLVYERQLAQEVGSYVYPTEAAGVMLIMATARPGVEVKALAAAVAEHLARVGREPVPAAHLERARNGVTTAFYSELQALGHRADLLSQAATYFDDAPAAFAEADRYREITAEDMLAFATDHARHDRQVEVLVVPEGRAD
jgi:predicted Zn-dependent peptidase